MLTLILSLTSKGTDLTPYSELLEDSDDLVTVYVEDIEPGESIVGIYNGIVKKSNKKSDILLLSDCVDLQGHVFDDMRDCLRLVEKHAIAYGQEIEGKKSLHEAAWYFLPDFTVTINSNFHCAMIKRKVINTLGFLDNSYKSLHYALLDFQCRINRYGFSSCISHYSLFTYNDKKRDDHCAEDQALLASRYEYRAELERLCVESESYPGYELLKLLDDDYYPKKRILFDCITMPPYHCGTSEYQISSYKAFYRLYKDKYEIFMYTNHEADQYHKLSGEFDNILYPDTITGLFHLCYVPNQLMFYKNQAVINKHCLKVVQTMFDIIMARRYDEFFGVGIKNEVETGIKISDGIVFISETAKGDFVYRYCYENCIDDVQLKVIYPTTEMVKPDKLDYDPPFDEYFLIVGNSFVHKALKETIKAVSSSDNNYIVVGCNNSDYDHPNVFCYMNGLIEDEYLSYLYANSKAVIYPSLYEGFGLPIVMGLRHNKCVLVYDNELNRELYEHFHQFSDYFYFFDEFEEINGILSDNDFSSEKAKVEFTDTWDRVAGELESFFEMIIEGEVDRDHLADRWDMFRTIEERIRTAEIEFNNCGSLRVKLDILYNQFGSYKLTSMLAFAFREYFRQRHPRFFNFVKLMRPKKNTPQ